MNILTFDIEDWFHILDHPETENELDWINYETRIEKGLNVIFQLLEDHDIKATFFVLGWVVRKHPNLIKKIHELGYEIGSHSHSHQLVYNQNINSFRKDVEFSIKSIEDCIGHKINCFRAPGFSITEQSKWAFNVLADLEITHDSSVFPLKRSHGGFDRFGSCYPSIIKTDEGFIKEFPISTNSLMGKKLVFSGGGYFRLCPYEIIRRLTKKSEYIMSYFHPRDFDYTQPLIPNLSGLRRFKSYVGLKKCRVKLDHWLTDFNFVDLRTADSLIDWSAVKEIDFNK